MPRYDYICSDEHVTEATRGYEVTTISCPLCGAPAQRQSVYLVAIQGETVARPSASRYQEMGAELDYAHGRAENDVGHELPAPNYYKHQLARAEGIDPNARASAMNRKLNQRARKRELKEAANGTA